VLGCEPGDSGSTPDVSTNSGVQLIGRAAVSKTASERVRFLPSSPVYSGERFGLDFRALFPDSLQRFPQTFRARFQPAAFLGGQVRLQNRDDAGAADDARQ
jgi:hypothetical protein